MKDASPPAGSQPTGKSTARSGAANEILERRPQLLNEDAFGKGWMLIVRASDERWRDHLVTGVAVGPAFEAWIHSEDFKDRAG